MLLSAALFSLVTVGFVVPCLIDVVATPGCEMRRLTKRSWVLLLVLFSVFGAVAWLVLGRPAGYRRIQPRARYLAGAAGIAQQDALRRHPAGRAMESGVAGGLSGPGIRHVAGPQRVVGPDDDPEFLSELAERIRAEREAGNDS